MDYVKMILERMDEMELVKLVYQKQELELARGAEIEANSYVEENLKSLRVRNWKAKASN